MKLKNTICTEHLKRGKFEEDRRSYHREPVRFLQTRGWERLILITFVRNTVEYHLYLIKNLLFYFEITGVS